MTDEQLTHIWRSYEAHSPLGEGIACCSDEDGSDVVQVGERSWLRVRDEGFWTEIPSDPCDAAV